MTFSIMTLNITTLSRNDIHINALRINDTQHNDKYDTQHNDRVMICLVSFMTTNQNNSFMLSVITWNAIMLSDVVPLKYLWHRYRSKK